MVLLAKKKTARAGHPPFYYMLESHRDDRQQTVPWNAEAGRAMTPAEGIARLQNNPLSKL